MIWVVLCGNSLPRVIVSEALHPEGGYVTWNLNIKQIHSGAWVPACWTAVLGGGMSRRAEGCVKMGMCEREAWNFVAGGAWGATRSNVLAWIIHDAILILSLEKIAFSLCKKPDSETENQRQP